MRTAQELFFRERLPWRVGIVRLDAGVNVIAYLHDRVGAAPCRVRVEAALDRAGQAVLVAVPEHGRPQFVRRSEAARNDLRSARRAKSWSPTASRPLGQAVARALAAAGAELIWIGEAEPWKKDLGFEALRELPQVAIVPLDVTDGRSVRELAGEIGGKVDILVNTADCHRTFSIASRRGVETAQLEMDVNYFGLLRLAQEFAPALKRRAADGAASAIAWVNVLSIFALSNYPPHGTYSASKAAAFSLSQALRAELQPAGVRVINLFPGPIDDEWDQLELPPKLSPAARGDGRRRGAQGLGRGRLSRRRGAGLARAPSRQSENARARIERGRPMKAAKKKPAEEEQPRKKRPRNASDLARDLAASLRQAACGLSI